MSGSTDMGSGHGGGANDRQAGRSATYKIVAGFVGVLALSLVWMATSFAVGANADSDIPEIPVGDPPEGDATGSDTDDETDGPGPMYCETQTANDGVKAAVLAESTFDNFQCDSFFFLDSNNDAFFFQEDRRCDEHIGLCENMVEVYWDKSCLRAAADGEHYRLIWPCVKAEQQSLIEGVADDASSP